MPLHYVRFCLLPLYGIGNIALLRLRPGGSVCAAISKREAQVSGKYVTFCIVLLISLTLRRLFV